VFVYTFLFIKKSNKRKASSSQYRLRHISC